MVADSEFVPKDAGPDDAAYTLVPIPLRVRLAKAFIPLALTIPLAVYATLEQLNKGTLREDFQGPIILALIGLGFAYALFEKEAKKVLSATLTPVPLRRRLGKVGLILGGALAASIAVWAVQFSSGQLERYWTYVWPIWLTAVFFAFKFFRESEIRVLTPQAEQYQQAQEKAKQEQRRAEDQKFELLVQHWWARYPLAALMVWLAMTLAAKPTANAGTWILVVGVVFMAGWLARELSLVLLGIGAVLFGGWAFYLAIQGVAALPVSLAIIIGAVIIASALRR